MSKATPSQQDYLEAILELDGGEGVRAKEIAAHLKVKMPSVTEALKDMGQLGWVNYAPYKRVTLTETGSRVAEDVFRKHESLRDFFANFLGVDRQIADEDACKIEHVASDELIHRILKFQEFLSYCNHSSVHWVQAFQQFLESPQKMDLCENCHQECVLRSLQARQSIKKNKTVQLRELGKGDKASIVCINGDILQKRLAGLEIEEYSMIEIEGISEDGTGAEIKAFGHHLHLDASEMECIEVIRNRE